MSNKISDYAARLRAAQQNKQPITTFTTTDTSFDVEAAYQVQMLNVSQALSQGDIITGKKIGLTSLAMQELLGVTEPDYGHLFASMACHDHEVDSSVLLQAKIEAEIAFILKSDLAGGKVTVDDVLAATAYVVGAFEIVDSRIADWKIALADTIADNASSGLYLLGEKRIAACELDLSQVTMKLYKYIDNQPILQNQGQGSDVLGNPTIAVSWLANKLWHYGVTLKAGEIVLSGALTAALPATKGDRFRAEFSDFGPLEAEFI